MTPTTVNCDSRSVTKTQPDQAGRRRALLSSHSAIADQLVQNLDSIGDAVSEMVEQRGDNAQGVTDAVTEVITGLDQVIFEAQAFLRSLSPSSTARLL